MRIGFVFNFNPVWMGGIIYLQNLVRLLGFLDDESKPEIVVYHRKDLQAFIDELDYPKLRQVELRYPSVHTGFLKSILTRSNHFLDPIWSRGEVDVLFPVQDVPVPTKQPAVSWFADLQHKHYPEFFSFQNRIERNLRIRFILRNCTDLVVSSKAVAADFERFFNIRSDLRIKVFRFVSPIKRVKDEDAAMVKSRFGLDHPYLIVCNQFHRHKNHRVVLRSLALLKKQGLEIPLVLTGRLPQSAHSEYLAELRSIISDVGMEDQIHFLGTVDRSDQIALMQLAKAVIQPSLFEGWSTVIEDAKSLQVPVIASNLEVHHEQLLETASYFDPHDVQTLSGLIRKAWGSPVQGEDLYPTMETRARAAAFDLLSILEESIGSRRN